MKLEQALRQYYKTCLLAKEMHAKEHNDKQVEYFTVTLIALMAVAFLGEVDLSQDYKEVMEQVKKEL